MRYIDISILTVQAIVDLITALGCLLRRCRTKIPNHMLEMSELKCYAHIAQITHIKQLNILQREEEKKSEIEQNIAHTHKLHIPHLLHTLQTLHTLQRGKEKNLNI